MKKFKITAVILATVLLIMTFASAVFAISADDFDVFKEYFGANTTEPANGKGGTTVIPNKEARLSSSLTDILNSMLGGALNGLSSSQINEILSNFDISKILGGDNEIINEIMDYIAAFRSKNPTTTKPQVTVPPTTQPPVTVPQYTYVYVTEPQQQYQYTYVYVPQSSTPPAVQPSASLEESTTAAEETTIVAYVPPQQVYIDQLTTVPPIYDLNIEEDVPEDSGKISVKMIAGIIIIFVSAVAVVGVSIALKKSRI